MIARPARVRIRSRKPWVLDRRRLFGWNVRLLTRYSYCRTSAVAHPPADGHARDPAVVARSAPRWTPEAGFLRERPAGRRAPAPSRGAFADSDQHSRGSTGTGHRPRSRRSSLSHRFAEGTEARRGNAGLNRVRRAGERQRIVARLWMRLLASPSLRVGPHGPATGPTRRLDRRSRSPVHRSYKALTSNDSVRQDRPAGPGWTMPAGRAHPVDSDVDPVSCGIHSAGGWRTRRALTRRRVRRADQGGGTTGESRARSRR